MRGSPLIASAVPAAPIARRDALRAQAGERDALAIAANIDRQLRGPSRRWGDIIRDEIDRTGDAD